MLVKALKYIAISYLGGIFLHAIFFSDVRIIEIPLILFITALGIAAISKKYLFIALICIGAGIGIIHYSTTINHNEQHILDVFVENNEFISLEGKIISYPINHESYTSFIIVAENLIFKDQSLDIKTQVLVKTDHYTDYEYGMRIVTRAEIKKPEAFETDSGRIFNYDKFLAKDDVYYTMSFAESLIIDVGEPSLVRYLYTFKQKFLDVIYRNIPSPESGLLAGILFGEKEALGQELEDKFRVVGLMHIVVLSGYNVSIIINVFMKLLVFLPRSLRAILAVLGIISFALLVGAGPTVIRASIMAVFIVLANIVSRPYVIERGLFIAGIIMVILNPRILLFDISFQLSFLATYGLIVLSPWLEEKFKKLPKAFAIQESAIATIAAQIMVAPLIIYSIGEFSIISPIVNVLVLFAVPYAMAFGFISAVASLIMPILAMPLSFIAIYLLKYQLVIVDLFSNIPYANISFPPFHFVFMIIMYIGIFWWIQKIRNKNTLLQK